jgi:hypothetical protein
MPWDPLGAWPNERRWIWLTVAFWVLLLRGPAFLEKVRATSDIIPDFFQEYASARNWFEGLPIYADHHQTVPRYLHVSLDDNHSHVFVNAHPPCSVMFALPFAKLDFTDAFLAWNLLSLSALAASLWIVLRQLRIPFQLWSAAPLLALLLLCHPLWEQIRLGQLTLLLLLLVTGSWAAERSTRPLLAGALLGAASAIKLFPAFLLVYFALRGRWRVVAAGLVIGAALTALSAIVLGFDAYRSYFLTVLPEIQWFRVGWNNDSLWGFWSRLFDPAPEHERDRSLTEPLFYSPALAKVLSLLSSAVITAFLAAAVRRDATGRRCDLTFALAVTAMLLISPICWDHYLLLLLVPLAVVWVGLPASRLVRAVFLVIVAAFWAGSPLVWTAFELNGRTATPVDSVGVLSYQFYALVAFFALVLTELRRESGRSHPPSDTTPQMLALGAVLMAVLWVHVLRSIWIHYGLFYGIGGDFGIYRSIAQAVRVEGVRAMYDLDLVASYARDLTSYYGPDAHDLFLGPAPFPAIYILPFLALTTCTPVVGYAIWTVVGLALAYTVVWGMARSPSRGWGLILSVLLSFPVVMALVYGQLAMLFLYGFFRAYRSFENRREFQAGLWSGTLYLKPQYLAPLLLVLLLKRRWRALGGLATAGLVVLLGSVAIVGPGGLHAQLEAMRAMSGFRDVMWIVGPGSMINWRGLLVNFLPEDVSDRTGQFVTVILSIATIAVLPLVWRGAWNPRTDRFPMQMLATVIVMMMASYHNHIHSASLLLVPGMAAAASKDSPRWLLPILMGGLYAPVVVYFVTASVVYVVWLIIALMLAALGIIVWAELSPPVRRSEASAPVGDASNAPHSCRATPDPMAVT